MSVPVQKLQEGIAFFENMLQSIPGDRTSLEFLVMAYEQTGDVEKRKCALIQLADTLLREKEFDKAELVANALSSFPEDFGARAAVAKVAEVAQRQILRNQFHKEVSAGIPFSSAAGEDVGAMDPSIEVHALSRSATATEMDLVWRWKERDTLSKDLCTSILRVLTDRPISDVPMTISAVALLDEQHPELTDTLLEKMQQESGMPFLPLEFFDPTREAAELLSPVFQQIKAVVPFAIMAGEALVALLNPFSEPLRKEIEERAKIPCHYYLVHPKPLLDILAKGI